MQQAYLQRTAAQLQVCVLAPSHVDQPMRLTFPKRALDIHLL